MTTNSLAVLKKSKFERQIPYGNISAMRLIREIRDENENDWSFHYEDSCFAGQTRFALSKLDDKLRVSVDSNAIYHLHTFVDTDNEMIVIIESDVPFTEDELEDYGDTFFAAFYGYHFKYRWNDVFGTGFVAIENEFCSHPSKSKGEMTTMEMNGTQVPCRVYSCDCCEEEFFKPMTMLGR